MGVTTSLPGREQVFRVQIAKAVANFGVVVTMGSVEPRVVFAGNENRLAGYTALPLNINPYTENWGKPEPAAGAVLPARGDYDVVFDSAGAGGRGFSFRLWVNDTTPPRLKLLTPRVRASAAAIVGATDAGSGVDPRSIRARVDGKNVTAKLAGTRLSVPTAGLAAGAHSLVLTVADFQESKNMEDVPRILPNTRTLRATFVVR
jgi:hypothetical protein